MLNSPLQTGFESFLFIIPIVICLLLSFTRRGPDSRGGPLETETWYTQGDMARVYQMIREHTQEWMKAEVQVKQNRVSIFGGSTPSNVYKIMDENEPRLLKLHSAREGPITFELTEVQGGGTNVKTSHGVGAAARIQSLKAQLPLVVHGMKAGTGSGLKSSFWPSMFAHNHSITVTLMGRDFQLCARCSGLVLGAITLIGLSFHLNLAFLLSLPLSSQVWMCFLLALPAIIDWTTHSVNLRKSNNGTRLVTGFSEGIGISLLNFIALDVAYKILILLLVAGFTIGVGTRRTL
jgi:uncharacterized membrane protein